MERDGVISARRSGASRRAQREESNAEGRTGGARKKKGVKMKGMGSFADGSDPTTLGSKIRYGRGEHYEGLVELVTGDDGKRTIAWFGAPGTGSVAEVTPQEVRDFGLDEGTVAVIEWNDGDEREAETSLRALKPDELKRLVDENECTAVEDVIAHYRKHPENDGHPAHRLYRIHQQWEETR